MCVCVYIVLPPLCLRIGITFQKLDLYFSQVSVFLHLDQSSTHCVLILILLWTFSFYHQGFLPLSSKLLDSPNFSFATFLISCVILSHLSFALPCAWPKPPLKYCFGKSFIFHPSNARDPWSFRVASSLHANFDPYIHNQYSMLSSQTFFRISFTIQDNFLSELLIRKKFICEHATPLLYMIRCSTLYLKHLLAIVR